MSFFRGQSAIHSTLLQDLANNLTEENFQKLKNHCKNEDYGRLGVGQLEKINSPSELFERLQQKAVIKEGNYIKLKNLLKLCENVDAIDLVEKAERELAQAGHHVVGYPYPGSDAAMQKYGPLASHYRPQMQTHPPAYSQQAGGQMHHEYYMSNVPHQPSGRYSEMMPQQYHSEPIHKSDAYPSASHQQSPVHSGGQGVPPHGNYYNQPSQPYQPVAPNPSFPPMPGVLQGQIPRFNSNQSCGTGNSQMNYAEYYDMQRRGFILFINIYFKAAMTGMAGGARRYEPRDGADVDSNNVRNTCAKYLPNHELEVVDEEVGRNKFWSTVDNTLVKLQTGNYSSFIFIISSHGNQEEVKNEKGETFKSERIVLEDESEVTLDEIKEKFNGTNAPFLNGKPKVFIIQACRGVNVGRLVPDKADCSGGQTQNLHNLVQYSRPDNADVLEAYATSSGTRAWRNSEEGTWYIKHLCKAISENTQRDHFMDLLLKVHNEIAARVTRTQDPAKQMPCLVTTFTKKFRLI